MAGYYIYLKAVHVAFMVTWFAGLFYLPRLFIYHVTATDDISRERFTIMERRLYGIMTIGALLTAVLGFALLWTNSALLRAGWFQVKLVLLALMVLYHLRCRYWINALAAGLVREDTRGFRWFNEIPVIFLLGIICLAVIKPF